MLATGSGDRPDGRGAVVQMRSLSSDRSQLEHDSGIQIGRWTQYAGVDGLPFGAVWCVSPPGGRSDLDCHPERELQVVVGGSGVVESDGATLDAPLGSAVLLDSNERHVVHNPGEQPLVLLSVYWM